MQTKWAIFLLVFLMVTGRADTVPAWNTDTQKAWWTQNPTPDSWPQAAKDLEAELEVGYKKDGSSCFSKPDFQGWLEHLEWIKLGVDCPDVLTDAANLQTFVALGKDEAISHLFVEKLDPLDDKKEALRNLLKLAQANLDDLHEYAALGIAYSLVFDQPFPRDWPHHQVKQDAVPVGDLDIVQRFNFYVQANRNKKTDLDLTQVPFEDLKFLVDSKIKLSEFEYAQKNQILYKDFANAFSSITYDEPRVRSTDNMVLDWNCPTYTLKDIETHGGICVDQAYYASMLGKGRGIPTIFFVGQGSGGGHAWFGFLARQMKWELDCGRYANQNYPKGYAVDPQTWQEIKDTTIEYQVKNGPGNPNYQAAKTALAWARLHSGDPSYRQILDDGRSIMPELADVWEAEADLMDGSAAISFDDKKSFYQAWIAQFQSSADLKVDGQTRLLALLKQANDPAAEDIQRSIILQNRSSGFDLGIKGSFSAISGKIDAKDWDGAKLEFEKAVRDFKDQGGGTFFNNVLEPYVEACAQHGQFKQAKDGIKFTEDRMSVDSQSILGVEFARMKKDLDLSEKLIPDVEKWLNELDDGNYEQTWNDAAKEFQQKMPIDQWVDAMNHVRKPLGKCTSRELAAAPRTNDRIGQDSKTQKEEYLYAQYDSVFETRPHIRETVVFEKGADNTWRAIGYSCKAGP